MGLGTLKDVTTKVHTKPNGTHCFIKTRLVPLTLREKTEAELHRIFSTALIRSVTFSAWTSVIVPLLKKNRDVRICVDFKKRVNTALQIDKYPSPDIDDLYFSLGRTLFYKIRIVL